MNRLNLEDRRIWLAGGAILALLIAAVGWLLFIHPKLSSASDLRSQASNTDVQNATLSGQVATLKRQNAHLATQRHELQTLLKQLPADNALTTFTRQVDALAAANKVSVTSLAFATPTAAGPTSATPAAADDPSASSDSSTPAPSATSTPVPAATSAPPTQYSTVVTLQTNGTAAHQNRFLFALQHGPRAVLVTSVQTTAAGTQGTAMSATLSVFSAPMTGDQLHQLNQLLAGKSAN